MEPADRNEGIARILKEADGGDPFGSDDGAGGSIFESYSADP